MRLAVGLALGGAIGALLAKMLASRNERRTAGLCRHLVLFAFKEGSPIDAIVDAFDTLATSLPELLHSYERGVQSSPEELGKGPLGKKLTHAFTLTFLSAAARDAYLPHPKHTKFVEDFVKPHVADVCVFDYDIDHEMEVLQ